ncbi:MAG: serine--tRNA ligase [Opitutae bacterium]|jgi:seryl-tRNA synthetase|nr:serine--tRNA ligase [Opitutae bacterium]MBT5692140.1 serine--tRNA ligase [Opitutae bacterium]MBT6959330.1 serine--tRNA ligase [Opitutae bacterium]MBT7854339.1 serine--tRNA ligase [Opitutae bacterium]
MLNLNFLRENPEQVRKSLARKKFECDLDAFYKLDEERRACISRSEAARSEQKKANKDMASMEKGSPEFLEKLKSMKSLSSEVKDLEVKTRETEERWKELYLSIPNLPDESAPSGDGEADNEVAATWGDTVSVEENAVPHWDIPWFSSLVDFERGTKVSGAGFPFYVGDMSRLVRALINFFLQEAENNGYEEVSAPLLVNADSARATGQLPDKEGQMYFTNEDQLYLIPTAEVPVTNFIRDEILDLRDLPLRRVGYTPCFRREAGSWGKDVRGLNRLHQFDKVELVQWVEPDKSMGALEELRGHAEGLLQKLDLPYRALRMCTGDIGFPHAKQYDLEVWSGGQKRWLEVSSCSCFTDFQARRASIRFRAEDGKVYPVHTLNGSALAIPRVLAALLENNYQPDGRVLIPPVLNRWFDKEFIEG